MKKIIPILFVFLTMLGACSKDKALIPVTGVSLNMSSLTIKVGEAAALVVSITPADADISFVTWKSSDPAIASVDTNGKVTGIAPGNVVISATTVDGRFTATCIVSVVPKEEPKPDDPVKPDTIFVSGITLDKDELKMVEGATAALVATITPADADNKNVVWTSSDENVVSIAADGTITAVSAGTATITVKTEDGGFTATCAVTVIKKTVAVTGISLDKTEAVLVEADTLKLTATIAPADADNKNVAWTSSDEKVATVTPDGVITAVSAGTVTITVKTEDGGFTATCTVTVSKKEIPVTGFSLDKTEAALSQGDTLKLTATITPADADNKNVIWTSSDEKVATVTTDGVITAVSAGTALVTVKTEDGNFTASCTVTVVPDPIPVTGITLDKKNLYLVEWTSAVLKVTVTPDDADDKSLIWTSSNSYIAKVDENGKVTAYSPGTATITVTTADGNYTATCTVYVYSSTVSVSSVSLDKSQATVNQGSSLQLTATINPSDATNKDVTWTSSNPTVATVDSNGKVTALAPGTTTITVTTEDGDKTAACTVTVVRPVISVSLDKTQATIDEGKTLQLTATVTPDDATNKEVTWSSSNTSVATVDANGLVTGIKKGETVITVTAKDGNKTATCLIHVIGAPIGSSSNENMGGQQGGGIGW